MRILLTNTGPWGTGSAMVAEAVQEELHRKGHEALLFSPDAGVETPDKEHYYSRPDLYRIWRFPLERGGLRLESFPLMIPDPNPRSRPGWRTFRELSDELLAFYFEEARRELEQAVNAFRPDIIECMHLWTTGYLAREFSLPCFATAHHSDQMGFRYDQRMRPYATQAAAGAQRIFCISEFVRRGVLELYPGVDPEKVLVLENGYNQRVFVPQQVSRAELLRALGVQDDAALPIVSFSGKISRTKGVDILLRANALLQRERKALLIIAGAGHLGEEFSPEEEADFHLENVHLVGHHPQPTLAQLHNVSTVSVIPSRTEGFGIAALEAMGCGAPLVATRSGGPESFAVGEIVPVEDPAALAQAILKILSLEPKAAQELRQAALEKARRYSWERVVERRLDCYHQVLGH